MLGSLVLVSTSLYGGKTRGRAADRVKIVLCWTACLCRRQGISGLDGCASGSCLWFVCLRGFAGAIGE